VRERTTAEEIARCNELADQAVRLIGELAFRTDTLAATFDVEHRGPVWSERVGRDADGHLIEAWELPWEASGLRALIWDRFDDLRDAVDYAETLVGRRHELAAPLLAY
jgi:hypothetical protein